MKAGGEDIPFENVDSDTLLESFRNFVLESVDYLPPEEMRSELIEAALDVSEFELALVNLEKDDESLLAASRLVLSAAWEDENNRTRIAEVVGSAKQKLPVIETGIVAIVVMYAMYLMATGGKRITSETRVMEDGSFETRHTIYEPPTAPLKAITNIFKKNP